MVIIFTGSQFVAALSLRIPHWHHREAANPAEVALTTVIQLRHDIIRLEGHAQKMCQG